MQSIPASISPQHGVAEAVRRHLRAVLVSHPDRLAERLGRERGGQVALLAGDPVADELDPPVAALRLLRDVGGELLGLDLVGVVADVALGPGDVPARPDQPREVLAVVDPRRVGGRAAVADEQGAAVPVGDRLPLGLLVADRPVVVEAQMAVRVHQPRDDPSLRHGLGTCLPLVGDPPVHDVQLAGLAVGQDRTPEPLRSHGGTLPLRSPGRLPRGSRSSDLHDPNG